jgi:hypothetical protein
MVANVHTVLTAAEAETEDVPLATEPTVVATVMPTSNDVPAGASVDAAAIPAVGSTAAHLECMTGVGTNDYVCCPPTDWGGGPSHRVHVRRCAINWCERN